MNAAASERPTELSDDVTDTGVFQAVLDGYDAVYGALAQSKTFNEIWRDNAYGGDFPQAFSHIGFLTLGEADRLVDLLGLGAGNLLVDIACGAGGPGLWVASQADASLMGVDPSPAGLAAARARALRVGLGDRARFQEGTFQQTGLPDGAADAVMTIEAFQYAPDKRAAVSEFHRVLRPGGGAAIVCFEVDPAKVEGLPVLGVDPIPDYSPLLESAGFVVDVYEETPGWDLRVTATFTALAEAADELVADIGESAAAGVLAEAMLTIQVRPYRRRVLIVARRPIRRRSRSWA